MPYLTLNLPNLRTVSCVKQHNSAECSAHSYGAGIVQVSTRKSIAWPLTFGFTQSKACLT